MDHLEFSKSLKEKLDEFCILSLNIQSLNAKFDELVILLHSLTNCKFSAICIQETWLTDKSDLSLFKIMMVIILSHKAKYVVHMVV